MALRSGRKVVAASSESELRERRSQVFFAAPSELCRYAMLCPKTLGSGVDSPKRCPNGGMITDYELVDILSTIFAHSHGFPQVLRVSGCCTGEQGTAAEVSALAWRGSAKDTLAMEAAKCGAIHFRDTSYLPGHKKRPISCSDT